MPFNRTIVELKRELSNRIKFFDLTFNRTIVELKQISNLQDHLIAAVF